jgi:uncharacterized SAM-binding protein YcdF (DUF218 family)
MLLFKHLITKLIFPGPLGFFLSLVGIVFLWLTPKRRTGILLLLAGIICLVLCGYAPISNMLLYPLENRYPSLDQVLTESHLDQLPKFIVVLGGGHRANPDIPTTSQLSDPALARLIEGIRIHYLIPESKLVLTGGPVFDSVPEAIVTASLAQSLGVDEQDILLETESNFTQEQAKFIQTMLGDEAFILVTSASHMPRSVALFRKLGMDPIPAPTDYWITQSPNWHQYFSLPSVKNLEKTERALYEYLGFIWAKVHGQI